MRRQYPSLLLAAFLVLASLPARADEWNKSYTLSGTADVRVDANDAEIEVRAADTQQVEARITTHGWKIGVGANGVQITEHQTGNRVDLQVRRPGHHFCIGICNQGVRVALTVPRQANLEAHSGDGHITISGVKGDLRLESGDGSIEARSVDGKLNADTRDGRVRVQGRFDALDLHSGDGSIEAEVAQGSRMSTAWMLRTGDGRLELRLPQDFAADLDAHTGDGRVSIDFPVTVSGSMRENSVRGRMNGGGQLLELRTGDGDIRVEKM